MSILKSTNSGKEGYQINIDTLLKLGWVRQPNKEGRDCFYWPNAPYGPKNFWIEYKSPENPKWYYQYARYAHGEEVPQGPIGFYVELSSLEYLITTMEDLSIVEQYWATYSRPLNPKDTFETQIRLKDKILVANTYNIMSYDKDLRYYKSKYDDAPLRISDNEHIRQYQEFCKNYKR